MLKYSIARGEEEGQQPNISSHSRVPLVDSDNAVRYMHILHRNDFSELLQTMHILDLTAELGTYEGSGNS